MRNKNQLSLSEIYKDCEELLANSKPRFLDILESKINIADFIPSTFFKVF